MRRVVRLLNIRYLRRHPLRTLLAALSVAAGTSILVAVLTEETTYQASLSALTRALAGPTPLRIVGADSHGGIDSSIVPKVAGTAGVAAAVPVVQTVAQVIRSNGTGSGHAIVLGVDCRVQAVVGDFGCSSHALAAASVQTPPVISTSLARDLGPQGLIETDLGSTSVLGAVQVSQLDAVNSGRIVVFPLPEAQQLFRESDRIDVIYIKPAAGTNLRALRARLAQVVGPQNSILTRSDAPPWLPDGNFLLPLLGLIALGALAVAAGVVFNSMALSLEERRRDLAIAGALGATPRTLIVGAMAEAAVIGLCGGALGAAAGVGVAYPIVGSLAANTENVSGAVPPVHVTPWPLLIGVVGGVVVCMAATWRPARRATRVDLTIELQQRGGSAAVPASARVVNALIATVGALSGAALAWLGQRGGGLHTWQPIVGEVGVVIAWAVSFIAIAMWAPLFLSGIDWIASRLGLRRGNLHLALTNLVRNPSRTAGMAVAVASAVTVGAALGGFLPAEKAAITHVYDPSADNRVFVSTVDPNDSDKVDSKVTPAMTAQILRLPGVAKVDRDILMGAATPSGPVPIIGDDGPTPRPYQLIEGLSPAAAFARHEVMIGPGLARSRHLHPGSEFTVATPTGMRALTVGGVWVDPDDLGVSVTFPDSAAVEALFGPQPPSEIFVEPQAGVSVTQLADTIRASHLAPGMYVLTPHEYSLTLAHEIAGFVTPFWALQRMLLAIALIATLSTLLLAGLQRRREQGILCAVGMGPRALGALTLTEAGFVGIVGSLLGIAASLVAGLALTEMAGVFFGLKLPFLFNAGPGFLYAALATAIVVISALWPAVLTQRLPVIQALRYE